MFFQVDESVTSGLIPAALARTNRTCCSAALLDPHNETYFTFVTSPVEGMATWDVHTALLPFFPSFILTGGHLYFSVETSDQCGVHVACASPPTCSSGVNWPLNLQDPSIVDQLFKAAFDCVVCSSFGHLNVKSIVKVLYFWAPASVRHRVKGQRLTASL